MTLKRNATTVHQCNDAKDRNQRWQSAAELKAAIERAVPTWARLEQALLSKFLRAWFKEDAERADALFDTLEAWRASGLSPWHQDDDELTAVRPMSGFEGGEEEFASTTGLRFPTRVRQATRPPSGTTPEERLLVSQAIARPRAAPRPMVWLIAGLIALSAATISVATVMLRPQRVEQIPLEGSEPPPVTAIRAAPPQHCLLYTSPSPRDRTRYRMPPSACKKNRQVRSY